MTVEMDLSYGAVMEAHADMIAGSLELLRLSADDHEGAEDCVRRIAAARDQLCGGDPRGDLLARRLGLSAREMSVLWLLVSISIRPDVRDAAKLVVAEPGDDPTLRCLQTIVYGKSPSLAAMNDLAATGALRRMHLMTRTDGDSTDSRATWAASSRVVRWLLGDDALDCDVASLARCMTSDDVKRPIGAELDVDGESLLRSDNVVLVCGPTGSGRRTHARWAAHTAGKMLLEIDASKLARESSVMVRQLDLIVRECRLLDLVPCILGVDALADENDSTRLDLLGERLLAATRGPVLATCGPRRPAMSSRRAMVVLEVTPLTSEQRAVFWLDQLGQGTQDDAEHLATQYPLAPALIHRAARAARARAIGRNLEPADIYAGIRAVLDDKLANYAKRVEVTQTWDDLVLPADQLAAIQYLTARIRQRRTVYEQWGFAAKVGKGLGTSALFSGPPGTGKTMVAALIAKDLGLELYQVDMAKITSKYIGETERNLAGLLDAAEAGHAILLFDEADSLFGKRTDVKSSNDRYANLETNYLLQRLESFTGICLLTSNHESNIDPAFQRRLSLHLRFELPDVDERTALWEAMLPSSAPLAAHINFRSLADRFAMSGGYIRNAALRAAFLAADQGSPIRAEHLEMGARLEYEGMGKIAL